MMSYRDGDTVLRGAFVEPPGAAATAGVLLVHGGAGLDDHAREQAVRVAAFGYVVFACDMFGDGVRGDPLGLLAGVVVESGATVHEQHARGGRRARRLDEGAA